jgi:hypothetical protein
MEGLTIEIASSRAIGTGLDARKATLELPAPSHLRCSTCFRLDPARGSCWRSQGRGGFGELRRPDPWRI